MKTLPHFSLLLWLATATVGPAQDKPVTPLTPAAGTNAPGAAVVPVPPPAPPGPPRTISLEVSVLRFKPLRAERILEGFRNLSGSLQRVMDTLKSEGEVTVLFSGTRDIRFEEKGKAKFDALETRPVLVIGKPTAPIPPATAYGVSLEVTTRLADEGRFGLQWEGNLTWSPEILDKRTGERFMTFATGAASAVKKSGLLGGDGKAGAAADIGLGLAEMFTPKGRPTENEIYELPVNKTVAFGSSRICRSGELIVHSTTAEMGNKEAQTVLLLILPTMMP